jgi:hypothetical protein
MSQNVTLHYCIKMHNFPEFLGTPYALLQMLSGPPRGLYPGGSLAVQVSFVGQCFCTSFTLIVQYNYGRKLWQKIDNLA